MRSIPYQYGERFAGTSESFGRIARRAPLDGGASAVRRVGSIDAGMVRQTFAGVLPAFALHRAARASRVRHVAEVFAAALRTLI